MQLRKLLFILIIPFFSSCLNDKADENGIPCDSTFFNADIKPIFLTNCYNPANDGACHSQDVPGNFSSNQFVMSKISEIKRRINLPSSHPDYMPRGRTLNAADLQHLNNWLDNGGRVCN
jgi:hypothetical protein